MQFSATCVQQQSYVQCHFLQDPNLDEVAQQRPQVSLLLGIAQLPVTQHVGLVKSHDWVGCGWAAASLLGFGIHRKQLVVGVNDGVDSLIWLLEQGLNDLGTFLKRQADVLACHAPLGCDAAEQACCCLPEGTVADACHLPHQHLSTASS